ncbi:MAG: non-homologous end-joining DNA ligase [Bryobacteraceae bacterium]|nr:non-homologous end-joining DNA ligase [Bryobacteraceae bacterium]
MPEEVVIPDDVEDAEVSVGRRRVRLSNLGKVFWPESGYTKRDLLRYYSSIAAVLVPHLRARAMVMKRYPDGVSGEHFFMKRTPPGRPPWLETCSITHRSASVIDFPVVNDAASLLWIVNLGCIDLNPWYARCGDTSRPDYLHFDLDPVPDAGFDQVREAALVVRDELSRLGMASYAKTTGSRGIHVYVPIATGPLQKEVWGFAKKLALRMEADYPSLITAQYRIAKRPAGRVLVDYNQNAWGRTLASVYSVRPKPRAPVSTPVEWDEVGRGFRLDDFRMENVPARIQERGDLWKPMLRNSGRARLEQHL